MSVDALRKLCAQTEEVITMELARIARDLQTMETRCRTIDVQMQVDAASYDRAVEQGLAIESVVEWRVRLDGHATALEEAQQNVRALQQAWRHTQARLVEAGQERKVLERLSERRRREHQDVLRRREQQRLDDAAHRRPASTRRGTT